MILKLNAAKVFDDPHRFRVLVAGRRFGKTRLVVAELARAAAVPRSIVWAIYPTYRQAKQVAWQVIKDEFPPGWIVRVNETDLTVHLINESSISLRGADNPDSLRGVGLNFASFDEFDFMDKTVWPEIVRPMLTTTGGRAMFVGTPDGFGPIYELFRRGGSGDPKDVDWSAQQFTTLEGGWVPLQEIEDSRRDMDEKTFKQEYLASFENATGRVYYAFDRAQNIREAPPPIAAGNLAVGMDFNLDPMSAVIFGEDVSATWVIDEITIKTSNTAEMMQEIQRRYGKRIVAAYPDPAGRHGTTNAPTGQSDHSILKAAGMQVFTRLKTYSVRDGINAVNSRLCSSAGVRRLFVSPKCRDLIKALEQHSYKEGTSQPNKDDGYDHICDALRYPMEYLHSLTHTRQPWQQ